MTSKTRMKRATSLLIGVLMLVSIGLVLSAYAGRDALTPGSILVAIMLVSLAAATVYSTFRATRLRGDVRQLRSGYLELYERVGDYLIGENLSKQDRRDIQEEWLELILTAQHEERDPASLYGDDLEEAMRHWIEGYSASNRKLVMVIDGVMTFCVFLVFLQIINYAKAPETGFFSVMVPNSILVYLLLLTFMIVPLARRFQKRGSYGLYLGIPVALFALYVGFSEALDRFFGETALSQWYNHGDARLITSPLVLIAIGAVIAGAFWLKRIIRKPL